MYIPYALREVPHAKQERCPYLQGEIGNTSCMIYYEPYRLGLEIADHVFCSLRLFGGDIPGCTYFLEEPKLNKSISIPKNNIYTD